MGDGAGKIEIIPDYFQASTPISNSHQQGDSVALTTGGDPHLMQLGDSCTPRSGTDSHQQVSTSQQSSNFLPSSGRSPWVGRTLKRSSFMMRFLNIRGIPFTDADGEEKVEISSVELESLRSELAALEEKEDHLKARLEHLDEILRWSRLSGYLNIRTRWDALPGEPLPLDDCDVDDWLPRFVVLQGPCLFFYLSSTDLSPQDSALLSDITEVGPLPNIKQEADEEIRYCFYILTQYGQRFECSSISKIQVDSWLAVLREDTKLRPDKHANPRNCT